jgi:asparagine synthase (glutamine-hydrolysing)
MCGIGGVIHGDPDRPVREADLVAMRNALRHRGPDDEGIFLDGRCGLAHTRLAILDLSSRGRQPMLSASGRFLISFNGEIYNFRELRADLEARGRRFETHCDTEVILHLMEEGGAPALEALRGMFAFALFDRQQGELLLVRDRLGIKPLFWTRFDEGVAFASEPKALRRLAGAGSPPPEWIAEYLAFRLIAGQESLQPGVQTLQPGERLWTDGRTVRVERWWHPHTDRDEDPERAESVLADAVRGQLVSDVPVGTFLSGGVDSALVTLAAAASLPQIDTFTVAFQDPEWDESDRARVVSDAAGTRSHRLTLSPDEYIRGLGEAIWFLDAPLNHAHSVHLLALSRFARRHVTVALTGEGADELFGGYPRYRLFRLGRHLRWLPGPVRDAAVRALRRRLPRGARLLEAADADVARAASRNAAFDPIEDAALVAGVGEPGRITARRCEWVAEALAEGQDALQSLLALERRTYLVSLLQRMDRMSMAAGLETRVPVLDEAVLDYALRLDPRHKLDRFDSKKPLRRAAERRLGRAYANAPKFGFGVPVGPWMRREGPLEPLVRRLLEDARTADRGWIDVERARHWLTEHRDGAADHTEMLWGLMNLELWARVCVDGDGPKGVPLT